MEWRGIGEREIKLLDFGIISEPERPSPKLLNPSVTKGLGWVIFITVTFL